MTVPDVVGRPDGPATQTLQDDNLTVGTTTFQTSTTVTGASSSRPTLRQGIGVEELGRSILVVSAGQVPSSRSPRSRASSWRTAISSSGRGPDYKVNYVSSNKPVGTVLDQNPAAGEGEGDATKCSSPCRAPRPRSRCRASSGRRRVGRRRP